MTSLLRPLPCPLLVLDIDGVLNSSRSMLLTGPMRNDHEHLDPVAVGLLDRMCKASNAQVAIISTWRDEFPEPNWWHGMFQRYQASHVNVVACLPPQPRHRGTLLQAWLDTDPFPIGPMVILDDSGDYLDHHPLVQVNPNVGLSAANAIEALSVLAPDCALLKSWCWWLDQDLPTALPARWIVGETTGPLEAAPTASSRKPRP